VHIGPRAVDGVVAMGTILNAKSAEIPSVVLGSVAAERLGVRSLAPTPIVYLTDTYFKVVGVLELVRLALGFDRA